MLTYAAVISYLRRRPRRKRPRCGAKTRAGRPCRMRVEFGKARCRLHGGLSTGPKTEAGRARVAVRKLLGEKIALLPAKGGGHLIAHLEFQRAALFAGTVGSVGSGGPLRAL